MFMLILLITQTLASCEIRDHNRVPTTKINYLRTNMFFTKLFSKWNCKYELVPTPFAKLTTKINEAQILYSKLKVNLLILSSNAYCFTAVTVAFDT